MSTLITIDKERINAAAAPDAIKVNAKAWLVRAAPAEAEKKVNGDLVRRPKLITSPVLIALNIAEFMTVKETKTKNL